MYYRNPDYLEVDRLAKGGRAKHEFEPVSLAGRLILSVGLIAAPVVAFFLILGIDRLVSAF
jgi:hypothetical protein